MKCPPMQSKLIHLQVIENWKIDVATQCICALYNLFFKYRCIYTIHLLLTLIKCLLG